MYKDCSLVQDIGIGNGIMRIEMQWRTGMVSGRLNNHCNLARRYSQDKEL